MFIEQAQPVIVNSPISVWGPSAWKGVQSSILSKMTATNLFNLKLFFIKAFIKKKHIWSFVAIYKKILSFFYWGPFLTALWLFWMEISYFVKNLGVECSTLWVKTLDGPKSTILMLECSPAPWTLIYIYISWVAIANL